VKIDVEGFELEVLGGFGELLSDPSLRAVIFESEDGLVQNTTHPVMRLLWAAGFGSVKPIPAEPNATRITNFVAARV
jgi:hypothetical protein